MRVSRLLIVGYVRKSPTISNARPRPSDSRNSSAIRRFGEIINAVICGPRAAILELAFLRENALEDALLSVLLLLRVGRLFGSACVSLSHRLVGDRRLFLVGWGR